MKENKLVAEKWGQFIEDEEVDSENIREVIYESWQRCKKYKVDPLRGEGIKKDKIFLENLRKKNENLIKIAEPFMKELANIVKNSNFAVVLTDSDGMILEVEGNQRIINKASKLSFIPGSYWTEEKVGTNAIGTALKIDRSLQVIGAEHYCKKHHPWTCSAAPIHNPEGELIGILDMSGYYKDAHLHTLGMVVAAAKSIEHQISVIDKNTELQKVNNFNTAVLNSISEALISINDKGSIILFNQAAARMLGVKKEEVKGRSIKKILGRHPALIKMLSEHKIFNDEEFSINRNQQKIYLNASSRMLLSSSGVPDGFIIILRKMKTVKKMVSRLAGTEARFRFKDIIGDDKKLIEVLEMAKMISDSRAAVLVQGESGTGKEMVAQAIHNDSKSSNQVFLSINCAAIPQSLLESELFGYEGGSFTGAREKGRPGKFELASGGTLLLDEIGEMPLNMQASLLRVLQEKEIYRIGGLEPIKVDVRIIASTNKNLEKEVERGNFRKDLFFRLNTVTIEIPPLRERVKDIEKLVKHFLFNYNRRSTKKIHAVENDVIKRLKNYSWPGNVRELQNVIERASLLSENGVITVEQLPEEFKNKGEENFKLEDFDLKTMPLLELEKLESLMLKKSLIHSRTITEAADNLGISRSTFYRKIEKYNIEI